MWGGVRSLKLAGGPHGLCPDGLLRTTWARFPRIQGQAGEFYPPSVYPVWSLFPVIPSPQVHCHLLGVPPPVSLALDSTRPQAMLAHSARSGGNSQGLHVPPLCAAASAVSLTPATLAGIEFPTRTHTLCRVADTAELTGADLARSAAGQLDSQQGVGRGWCVLPSLPGSPLPPSLPRESVHVHPRGSHLWSAG